MWNPHCTSPIPASLCLVQTLLGVLALFPWEQGPENPISPESLPSFRCSHAFCTFICGFLSISLTFLPSLEGPWSLLFLELTEGMSQAENRALGARGAHPPAFLPLLTLSSAGSPVGLELVHVHERPSSQSLPSGISILDKGVKADKP